MTIDWSKAPEGATHWDKGLDGAVAGWMRLYEGQWYWWPVDGAHCDRKWYACLDPIQPKFDKYIARPSEWNGEGPPPVGTVCEVTTNDGHNWHPWKVLFADEYVILVGSAEGKANYELLRRCDADVAFRPIRTAEQIAAEERELALTDMCVLLGKDPSRPGVREKAGVLFDAGYRKQVAQ